MSSSDLFRDPTPQEVGEFMDRLTFTDEPVDEALLPVPQPWEDAMVPRSVRWSAGLDKRIKDAATERGLTMSELMRQFAEAGLAAMASDELVSKTEIIRWLAGLHGRPAA